MKVCLVGSLFDYVGKDPFVGFGLFKIFYSKCCSGFFGGFFHTIVASSWVISATLSSSSTVSLCMGYSR